MYTLKTEHSFDAAHFLYGYEGKCSNIHGHRWRVVAEVSSDELETTGQNRGMYVDFGDLKKDLKEIVDYLDHCLIIETGSLKETTLKALQDENFRIIQFAFRPTAENMAKYFYDKMIGRGYRVKLFMRHQIMLPLIHRIRRIYINARYAEIGLDLYT